jgi:glycosyltransferase involved in cell wall biosynthesis
MRILVVCSAIDRSECALYRAFASGGREATILCPEGTARSAELADAGATVLSLRVRHRLDLRAVRVIRRLLASQPFDVIYAPANKTLSVSLLASRGAGVPVVGYRGTVGHISRWDPASWLTYLNPRLSRILCVSEAVRRYLCDMGVPPRRLVTIYKGHDPAWYAVDAPADLSEFNLPPGTFAVAFTGNVRPVKGVDVLLEAVRRLPPGSPVRVLIVGEVRDPRVAELTRDPVISERVRFAGYRSDAVRIVAAADAYVMPSVEREGLPRGVIEAMCLERPVVVSRVGGMPELVEDGVSGVVVPPRDPGTLAAALLGLAGDPARATALGAAARKRIASEFHIERTIQRVLAVFDEVVARAAR